ncbi:IQ calmodulin-binding motif protein [Verticillium alfalfae VaMs.102]|uniref:IQ calmodulin-binding motif protein n=1 Tax=Verticillium alfalfae (strain VaMs.102 / ATCC MYA-4576 / FGSC 10136) TaxID=526221 RepID=C9SHC7_VERA1|nr:IQ calmodulin-binding motif protein [Verticillium alfalfae VaMs.102]EEY17721.1 IQ calmodulin-binding motif protein [Verticillium alfalfae VaMs.102]
MPRPTSEQSSLRSQPRRKSIEAFRSRRAAKVIQRSYRGYRSRRESKGLELAASTRWVAAIQEAQFRETTKPRAREAMAPETGEAPTMLSREDDGKHLRHRAPRRPTPAWSTARDMPPTPEPEVDANDSRSESSIESALEADRAAKYATPEVDDEKPHRKVMHVSASTIFNKMLRKSVRKNTWIFVADTNFRLYVGIKSSGAFQHSSFLQGSRISSAGLIKVKDGKIKSLSPLSGHYRPPTSNFRAFIRSLRESRVDVSHVSISKSYAVLVGLETYVRTRKKGKHVMQKMSLKKDKLVAPEAVARREEEERDKSESAAREREILEAEAAREQQEREENSAAVKLMRKLHIAPTDEDDDKDASTGNNAQPSPGERVDEGDVSTQGGTTARTRTAT